MEFPYIFNILRLAGWRWLFIGVIILMSSCKLSTDIDTDRHITLLDSLEQSPVKPTPVIVTPVATFYEKGTSLLTLLRDTTIQDSGRIVRLKDTTVVVQNFNTVWAFRTAAVTAKIDTSTSPMSISLDLQLIDDSLSRSTAKIIRPEYVVSMHVRLDSIPAAGTQVLLNSPDKSTGSRVSTISPNGFIEHVGILKVFFGKSSRTNNGKNGEIQLIISANIPTQDKQFQSFEFGGLITMTW
ncbi:MAG: hypothetical protein U0264_18340 [Candidatus Kapaibacterium sp.]